MARLTLLYGCHKHIGLQGNTGLRVVQWPVATKLAGRIYHFEGTLSNCGSNGGVGHETGKKRITLHTDNMAAMHILNKTTPRDCQIMALARKLVIRCVLCNLQFRAVHIPGYGNVQDDLLSRLHVEICRLRSTWASKLPVLLPADIQTCNWYLG